MLISGLSAIAARYDALLCDVWGVLHNGREAYPVVADALGLLDAVEFRLVLAARLTGLGLALDGGFRVQDVVDDRDEGEDGGGAEEGTDKGEGHGGDGQRDT